MRCSSVRARIGIYEPGAGPSGPSRYVDSILSGIDRDEFEVAIFGDAGGPYASRADISMVAVSEMASSTRNSRNGCKPYGTSHQLLRGFWHRLTPGSVKLWGGFGRECIRLAIALRQTPIDLFHTNCTGCDESAVAARLAGIPRVLGTFHTDSTYDLAKTRSGFRHRMLECLSNHCLSGAIAVSRATKTDWVKRTGLRHDRVATIHNGIDAQSFQRRHDSAEARRRFGLSPESLVIGGVGRLDEAKGFRYLLEAAALLAGRYPHLVVVLAGQGPLSQDLTQRAAGLGISDRVRLLGFCPDIRQVYEALDIAVLSSLCEALPYALLEAMAVGLPVVGTRVGGVPEVIVPGETGTVVAPGDAGALAQALRPLLDSLSLRQRMGRAGRERVVREFNERDMVRRTIQVYRGMVGRARVSGSN